jgi:hypothetical protein
MSYEEYNDDHREDEPDDREYCPNCHRRIDVDNPWVGGACLDCGRMRPLEGEIFLFEGKNPIAAILGWLFGRRK